MSHEKCNQGFKTPTKRLVVAATARNEMPSTPKKMKPTRHYVLNDPAVARNLFSLFSQASGLDVPTQASTSSALK